MEVLLMNWRNVDRRSATKENRNEPGEPDEPGESELDEPEPDEPR
jgi:hypothetical protein